MPGPTLIGQKQTPPPPHMLVPMESIMIQVPGGTAIVTTMAQCFCGCGLVMRFEHQKPEPAAPNVLNDKPPKKG